MQTVGVIGLGNIGGHVAAHLVSDGFDVIVCDVRPSAVDPLVERGARRGSPVEVGAHAGISLLSLPSPPVIEAVVEQWLAGSAPESILVDLSTNSPEVARDIELRVKRAGRCFLESPLTGGAPGAMARTLVFMVGGDEDVYRRAKPILDRLSRATFHLGPVGAGSTAKLVNSLLAFASTWVSLEGLAMAARSGIEPRAMVEVIRAGGAGNFYTDRMVDHLDAKEKPVMFGLGLAAKDAALVRDLGERLGVPTPVARAIAGVFEDAVAAGLSGRDWSALEVFMEQRCGTALRLGPDLRGTNRGS